MRQEGLEFEGDVPGLHIVDFGITGCLSMFITTRTKLPLSFHHPRSLLFQSVFPFTNDSPISTIPSGVCFCCILHSKVFSQFYFWLDMAAVAFYRLWRFPTFVLGVGFAWSYPQRASLDEQCHDLIDIYVYISASDWGDRLQPPPMCLSLY